MVRFVGGRALGREVLLDSAWLGKVVKRVGFWAAGIAFAFGLGLGKAEAQVVYKYYEVAGGDTVYSISTRYGIDPDELVRINANTIVDQKGLQAGAILLIPVSPEPPKPRLVTAAQAEGVAANSKDSVTRAVEYTAIPEPGRVKLDSKPDGLAMSVPASDNVAKNKKKKSRKRRKSHRSSAPSTGYSIAVGSDGQVVKIPNYVPPVDEDEEADGKATSSNRAVKDLLARARSYMGVPYVWGGTTPDGFDCSGYVQYVYREVGVKLPRTADVQYNEGKRVAWGSEAPGDMVFFETYAPGASHVGIYLGDRQFIHASSSGCVRVSSLEENYFKEHYLGAKRVL